MEIQYIEFAPILKDIVIQIRHLIQKTQNPQVDMYLSSVVGS